MTDNPAIDASAENRHSETALKTAQPSAGAVMLASGAQEYSQLATIVLMAEPLGAVMSRIADLAALIVPGVDDVSVTLIERGRARTVAFSGSGRLAAALDERQYEDGFGPCMDAAISGQVIMIEDTAQDQTYPAFARQAQRQGVRRALAIGMPTAQDTSGALNLYSSHASGPFEPVALEIATTFASYASIALLNASLYAGALNEVTQMREALASRAGIEQAKGIIMHERRCSADEAFNTLRIISSQANRKLRDVAQTIICGATT
jgi:GAF domain-containing protein